MKQVAGEPVAALAPVELKVAYLNAELDGATDFGVRSRSGQPSRSSGLPL
jgi:hypothetical protein